VDDSLLVGFLQSLGDLASQRQRLFEWEGAGFQTLRERRALDELHDEGFGVLALLQAEDRGDVRVMQLGQELCLALETRQTLPVFDERRGEHLDRHVTLQLGVGRAVDLPHPALAQRGGDLVGAETNAGAECHSRPCAK